MEASATQITPPPAQARWRGYVALAVIFVVASVAYASASLQPEGLPIFKPKSSPPARLVVCEGTMDVTCAQRAAERAFTTVAWIDEPSGYELAWVWAKGYRDGPATASQYLLDADGQGAIELVTALPAVEVEPGTPPARSASNGTDTASVWVNDEFGVVQLEWTHDGIGYLINAKPRPWDPSTVIDAWTTIQYASPEPS